MIVTTEVFVEGVTLYKDDNSSNIVQKIEQLEESASLSLIGLHKVIPRVDLHDYKNNHFYIYCYLNPFKKGVKKFEVDFDKDLNDKYNLSASPTEFIFGYEPIYIGKATGAGYRHNQHLIEFAKSPQDIDDNNRIVINHYKKEAFQNIEKNMEENKDDNLPSNWKEYKDNWIIILTTANDQEELMRKEKALINSIGTIRKGTGSLTNATFG